MSNKKKNNKEATKRVSLGSEKISFSVWICAAAILILTCIVFSPSLKNDFTNIDDDVYVTNNPLVVNDTMQIGKIFETPVSLNYHPLTILSLVWNYQSGKLDPKGYHLWNVIFHLLNTVLVFFFIFLLTRRNLLMASIVALFFGIHPMHVESVSWVSERKDVLYVLFFIAGLISYLRFRQTKKILWYCVTLLLFILSCLSKGMAVVFPVVLLLIDYFFTEKWERRFLVEKIPFFIISIGFGIAATVIQKSGGAMTDAEGSDFIPRIMIASYGTVMYVVKLLAPFNLAVMYPKLVNEKGNLSLMFYFAPFILLSAGGLVYFFLRKEKAIVFGLLFYLVSVALVLQFISVGMAVMADRYSYLSYVGLLFVAAYLINKVWQARTGTLSFLKYPVMGITIITAIIFSFQTYARTQVWKNSETLWADEMNKYPNISFLHIEKLMVKSALYYQSRKKYDLALDYWNSSLMLNPNDTFALNNRALIFIERKNFENAEKDLSKVIMLDSTFQSAYYNRGIYFCNTNQYDKAVTDFTKNIRMTPSDSAYNWRGVANHKLKRFGEAITDFSSAIELRPLPVYWLNRSFSENALGDKEAAKSDAFHATQSGGQVDINYLKYLGLK